jgi:hypothetical protein
MNIPLVISGVLALIAAIGHTFGGSKKVMPHVLEASFDLHAKVTIQALWFAFAISLFLFSTFLIVLGINQDLIAQSQWLVRFISVHYFLYSFVFFIVGLNSDLNNGILKLFQWIVFLAIAILSWLSV